MRHSAFSTTNWARVVHAYSRHVNPPALTAVRVFTAWRAEPGILVAAAAMGASYLAAVRSTRRAGRSWPFGRIVCFASGIVALAVIGCSFLGVYGDTLFWVRAVQNILLLMVVPMLLALGAPIRLAADLLPPATRVPLAALLHSRVARMVTFPLVVTLLLVVPLLVLYLSPLYELTLRSPVATGISGSALVVTGFVYFWTRFRIDPTPRADPYGVTIWITVVEMIGDAVLGVVLWLGPLVAVGYYAALARNWGPDLRTDQILGAGVLWIGGDAVGLPFIGIVLGLMTREDRTRAVAVDADLDAAEEEGGPARLWWEDVPEIADRFRRG